MISQHFITICTERKVSKTYGGSDYTLRVFEVLKDRSLKFVVACSACTRGHKGEKSEAFTALLAEGAIRPSIVKRLKDPKYSRYCTPMQYAPGGQDAIEIGLFIREMGGA